jgi:hypothetical protein
MNKNIHNIIVSIFLISACGGGGGGGGDTGTGGGGGYMPAPIASISSSMDSVEVNTNYTLTWSSTNATSCTASGDWSDSIGTSGSKTLSESSAGSKTYTITCTGAGGSASDSATVVVTNPPEAPTATITANLSSVIVDNSFTLTWSSTNATECAASGDWSDSIDTSGTQSITETETGVKTYTITCTGDGGSATDSASVTVDPAESDTAFNGFAIDGYISGANIFIDQNFNFKQDDGEYTAVTNTDGSFTIETNDADVFACLKKRPIVADVPVGAVDSTLGGVTEAYQMILPSVEDAGTNTIVISPFTSLISEAILTGKNDSNLVVELSVEEGCETKGDNVATNISTAITELKNSIEANFGITYDQLLGDFVANSTNEKVTEEVAQKIASFFPSIKALSNEVSSELSQKYDTEINVDLVLSQKALNTIFTSSGYSELPLNFNTFYRTPQSDDGWYTEELIYTVGAFLTSDGEVKNYKCLSNNESDCINANVTLATVADAAETFMRTTFFRNQNTDFYTPPNGTQPGSLNINALDSRTWSVIDNKDRRNCENREEINFNGIPEADGGSGAFRLDYNYQATINVSNQLECNLANRNRNVGLNLVVKPSGTNDDNTLYGNYFVTILANTELIDKRPVNLVDDYKTLDTDNIVGKIATLPIYYSEISDTRKIFTNNEGYQHSIVTPDKMRHSFTIRHQPWEDSYSKSDSNGDTVSNLTGQPARDAMYQAYTNHPIYSDVAYAGSAAAQSDVLFNHIQSCLVYNDSKSSFPLCWTYDADSLTAAYDFAGSSTVSLSDIHDLLDNGYTSETSLDIRGALKPDDSIQGSTDLKFNLERVGENGEQLSNSDSMEITFKVNLDGDDSGLDLILSAGEKIYFKYITSTGTILSKTATNLVKDSFLIKDLEPTELLDKPSSLGAKVANLLNLLNTSELTNVKDYFVNDGSYKLTINLGDYYITNRGGKRVKNISSIFKLSNNPLNVASIYDYSQWESTDQNLCVFLSKVATENVSVKIVDVTPQGVYGNASPNDWSLSSNTININSGDSEECVTFTAINDEIIYEGSEYVYFELQEPAGISLGRSSFKVEIYDHQSSLDPRDEEDDSSQPLTQNIDVSIAANNSGSGNVYVIDGTQKKSLTLNVGTTYTFNHSSAHPFRFSETDDGTHGGGVEYTSGVTKSSGVTSIEVTSSTPTTLYYYCDVHAGMGADININ